MPIQFVHKEFRTAYSLQPEMAIVRICFQGRDGKNVHYDIMGAIARVVTRRGLSTLEPYNGEFSLFRFGTYDNSRGVCGDLRIIRHTGVDPRLCGGTDRSHRLTFAVVPSDHPDALINFQNEPTLREDTHVDNPEQEMS